MRLIASIAVAAFSIASLASAQGTPSAAPTAPAAPAAKAPTASASMEYAVMRTSKGDIVIELDRAKAPITVENFAAYIKEGFFDGTVFHRVVPNFVIQGGGFTAAGEQKKTKAPITNEWQNGLKNKRGTLSMARTNDPNSASSQFFISLKDNDMLDQPISGGAGYAVFGSVISGMDIVDAIAGARTTARFGMRDWPIEDVTVSKAEMISKADADKLVAEAKAKAPAKAPAKPQAPAAAPATPEKPVTPAAPTTPAAPAAPKKQG
jgi:cyclophilin family peptidyl-prolyl cis-trans isomerase